MSKILAICTFCEHEFEVGHLQTNISCPNCNAMLGYWEKDELDKLYPENYVLTVPKNTPYHSMFIGWTVTRKKYNVRFDHMLPGSMIYELSVREDVKQILVFQSNPTVSWVGASGYWKRADVNYFRDFNGGWDKSKVKGLEKC